MEKAKNLSGKKNGSSVEVLSMMLSLTKKSSFFFSDTSLSQQKEQKCDTSGPWVVSMTLMLSKVQEKWCETKSRDPQSL